MQISHNLKVSLCWFFAKERLVDVVGTGVTSFFLALAVTGSNQQSIVMAMITMIVVPLLILLFCRLFQELLI